MALAVIIDEIEVPHGFGLVADIGTNRFAHCWVGSGFHIDDSQLPVLDGVSFNSPLVAAAGSSAFQTRVELHLDSSAIDHGNRFVQIVSYRDADRNGPAWSMPRQLLMSPRTFASANSYERGTPMEVLTLAPRPTRSIPLTIREYPVSSGMIWQELLGMLGDKSSLASKVIELLGSGSGAGAGAGGAATPAGGAANKPADVAAGAPDLGALLAQLKPLAPLLQKAPELLRAYADTPVKLFNAAADAERQDMTLLTKLAEVMLAQGGQQLLMTLLQNGGPTPPTPQPSAESLSVRRRPLSRQSRVSRPNARTLATAGEQVQVEQRIGARLVVPEQRASGLGDRTYYSGSQALTFDLQLTTSGESPPRPIPGVEARIRMRDAATSTVLLERIVAVGPVRLNDTVGVTLAADAVAMLPAGVDITASVDVRWKARSGSWQTPSSRAVQQLTVVKGSFINQLGTRTVREITLDDPVRDRAFWHRVWETDAFVAGRWGIDATIRYYLVTAGKSRTNARMDTRMRSADGSALGTTIEPADIGVMKSGLEYAVDELNALLPRFQLPPWDEAQLEMLRTRHLRLLSAGQSTSRVQLRGRAQQRGAVWAVPVIELQEFSVHQIRSVGPSGVVQATEVRTQAFPWPVAVTFVGTRST